MPQYTLQTPRLLLRPFSSADSTDLFEFLSDRDTCYDDGGYEPFAAMDEKYQKLMDKFAEDEGRWMIVLRDSGKVIGTIHLMEAERAVPAVELGYVINPHFRCQGYATEALHCVIEDCFANGTQMLVASAYPYNQPSIHLLEKLGFAQEGITHKAMKHPIYGVIDSFNFYLESK